MVPPTYSPPAGQARTSISPLVAVAGIAARLASRDVDPECLAQVVADARAAVGADECVLWSLTPGGLVKLTSSGRESSRPDEVSARLAGAGADEPRERDGLLVHRLVADELRLGALSLRFAHRPSPEQCLIVATIADMLVPALAHAEHARQLEVEVELRSQQNDDQRRFIEKIIDSLPVGLYVIDRDYRIQAWNRKRETGMQGVSREEALGRTIFEILHRQPAESLRGEFDQVFRTGRIQTQHMESKGSGDVRTFRISKIPMRMSDAGVTHVIAIGEDVTEWKEAQERFAHAEKLAAIGQLAAGVMHEINNPLATIAACAESLALRFDDLRARGSESGMRAPERSPADASEFLQIIDNEVHRCKRIVDGLLDFSRPKPADKASIDVNEVVDHTLFLVKHHARFKKLHVETALERGLDRIHANREQIVQVFMALLLNAVDAMGDSGTITIRSRRGRSPREAVIAEVIDQGHGIPRSETSKIFEPFYTTKAPGRGTGLGLSICYGIIADHGGRIEVESAQGLGSTFRILLPAEEAL